MNRTILLLVVFCLFSTVFAAAGQGKKDDRGPLEKLSFIHYKEGFVKPTAREKATPVDCYRFLARGTKWKTTEPYLINPINSDDLNAAFVESVVNAGVAEWEKYGGNIFGSETIDYNAKYIDSYTDGKNTITFGLYPNNGVIAVTNVWGYFSGPTKTRELVEWDLLFNDAYFVFGNAMANPTVMDLQNIATHEFGHATGMNDLYNTACYLETMYGYSTAGETSKRDLYTGDIIGIKKLYGS